MSNFVDSFRQQSWYPTVKATMDQYGVPEAAWTSIIQSESGGNANANAADANASDANAHSYGLFQLNGNPRGLDPGYSAQWAAPKIAAALKPLPANATPTQVVQALENAAWPGSAVFAETHNSAGGSSSYAQSEEPGRVANYQAALADLGQGGQATKMPLPSSPTVSSNPVVAYAQQTARGASNLGSIVNGATTSLTSSLQTLSTEIFVGGLILAFVAGGFALLQGSRV